VPLKPSVIWHHLDDKHGGDQWGVKLFNLYTPEYITRIVGPNAKAWCDYKFACVGLCSKDKKGRALKHHMVTTLHELDLEEKTKKGQG
jgi:hypothetical protein